MECKGERAQRRLDELLSEIDDWATEAFWTGFYSGCEHERELIDEINWLNAELHGAEQRAERTCHTIPYNSQAEERADTWTITAVCSECGWTLEMKKGDKVRMHEPYCGGCGSKVVDA